MKNSLNPLLMVALMLVAQNLSAADGALARQKNDLGFQLYKSHKYHDALRLFEEAAKLDPSYATAHYNAACTMGILNKAYSGNHDGEADPVEPFYFYDQVAPHLIAAFDSEPARQIKALKDEDLASFRDERWFVFLTKFYRKTGSDIQRYLSLGSWWLREKPDLGCMPMGSVIFKRDGQLVLLYLQDKLNNFSCHEKDWVFSKVNGHYTVDGNVITMFLNEPILSVTKIDGSLDQFGRPVFLPPIGNLWPKPPEGYVVGR